MIEKLIPKNVELKDFLKEVYDECEKNEKYNTLIAYKNSNSSTYTLCSNIHSFLCLVLGSLFAYITHDFQIWMIVLSVGLFIGVILLDKFINVLVTENELVILSLADLQYDEIVKLLKTKYKSNLSNSL